MSNESYIVQVKRLNKRADIFDMTLEAIVEVLRFVAESTPNVINGNGTKTAHRLAKRTDQVPIVERPRRVAVHHDDRSTGRITFINVVQSMVANLVEVGLKRIQLAPSCLRIERIQRYQTNRICVVKTVQSILFGFLAESDNTSRFQNFRSSIGFDEKLAGFQRRIGD